MNYKLLIGAALYLQAHLTLAQTAPSPSSPAIPRETQAMMDFISKLPPPTEAQKATALALQETARAEAEVRLNTRYVVAGNDVYDQKTNLTWQRCNFGQTWDEENRWCKGVTKRMTIDGATADIGKSSGTWRVPDAGEMMSLLEIACTNTKSKTMTSPVFPEILQRDYYLTKTSSDPEHVSAAQCFGSSAMVAGLGRKYVSVLRLVREGK